MICVTLVHKRLDYIDDYLHVLRYLRVDIGAADIQALCVNKILPDSVLGDLRSRLFKLVSPFDDLIVNVGEILHVQHLIPAELQIPPQRIEHAQSAGVTDVYQIVYRRSAAVYFDRAILNRH